MPTNMCNSLQPSIKKQCCCTTSITDRYCTYISAEPLLLCSGWEYISSGGALRFVSDGNGAIAGFYLWFRRANAVGTPTIDSTLSDSVRRNCLLG